MGGEAKLKPAVEQLVEIMLEDERINFVFAQTELTKFKHLLYTQLCELAGGPASTTAATCAPRTPGCRSPMRSSTRRPKTFTLHSIASASATRCRTK
jgi:truncated hemoglobin YjbI